MKVIFVLPPFSAHPVGGYQIVYQYANALTKRGYQVYIYYLAERFMQNYKYIAKAKTNIKRVIELVNKDKLKLKWFDLDPRIKSFYHQDKPIKGRADAVIATAAETADFVNEQSDLLGNKFYFVQGYETWVNGGEKFVKHTYELPLKKVVPAKWLQKIIFEKTSESSIYIPNFIDESEFNVTTNIKKRSNTVSLLNHILKDKNTQFSIEVLKKVKESVPDLQVLLFGVPKKPKGLPNYFHYFQQPNHKILCRKIYNQSKIYLMAPKHEGWGLTGMEAMASGAVLVASNVSGIKEYAKDQRNSRLLNLNNFQSFVDTIVQLLRNDNEREGLVNQGLSDIKKYTLTASTDKWEEIIKNEK